MDNGTQRKGGAMRTRAGFPVVFWRQPFSHTLIQTGCLAFLPFLFTFPSHAETPSIPWECSTYQQAAQTRCLNTLIELQREKVAQLEGQLRAQEGTVRRLKDQVDRQTVVTQELQRWLSDQPAVGIGPIFYPSVPYLNFYPPGLGFGIHFGSSWAYGPSHFYDPLWSLPYYRSWRSRY
jgi:hypothetical protein